MRGKKEQRGKEKTQEEVGVTQGFTPKQSQVVGVLVYKAVVIGIEASESQHDAIKKRVKHTKTQSAEKVMTGNE